MLLPDPDGAAAPGHQAPRIPSRAFVPVSACQTRLQGFMLKQVLVFPSQFRGAVHQGILMSHFADERDELSEMPALVATGNQRAFAELYRRTATKLFGLCLRIVVDHGAAEEVLQEIYTTVWRRAESFDVGRPSAITWLMALPRNKVIDRLRQRHERQAAPSMDLDDLVDEQSGPATQSGGTSQLP